MWLKLELCGMKLEFRVKGYQTSSKECWDYQWCDVDFAFRFLGCIDYSKQNDEVLLSCEIENLESEIDDFINNKIKEKKTMDFIEPDFKFEFRPSYNMVEAGEYVYITPEYKMSKGVVEWKVFLWDDGLTDNYFSTILYKDDLRVLRDYLRLVIGKLNIDSFEIQEHIKAGLIVI